MHHLLLLHALRVFSCALQIRRSKQDVENMQQQVMAASSWAQSNLVRVCWLCRDIRTLFPASFPGTHLPAVSPSRACVLCRLCISTRMRSSRRRCVEEGGLLRECRGEGREHRQRSLPPLVGRSAHSAVGSTQTSCLTWYISALHATMCRLQPSRRSWRASAHRPCRRRWPEPPNGGTWRTSKQTQRAAIRALVLI